MVLQEKIGVRSVRIALSVLTGIVLIAGQAFADEAMQKVEITGSSIKRIAVEGALPVQRLSQEQIAKTGATTVADLIQSLPAMQGFSIAATAAGSNSGGIVSASIHNIGESYTLVLLDGRRIAPTGSGSTINLNSIPMSAVERVEILTDGASALYGSDAIAGVINFILKKNVQGGTLEATYGGPEEKGGNGWNTNVTYGVGDIDEDRYNVLFSYRHDEQSKLNATDRSFAKSSYIPVSYQGKNYIYDRTSPSTAPGNATVAFKDGEKNPQLQFSPYLAANGNCGPTNYVTATNAKVCGFDGGSTVEIVPESKRDSLFTRATYKLSDSLNAFAEVALSRYDLTARISANPVQIPIAIGSDRYNEYVQAGLTQDQRDNATSVTANYRMSDWGNRTTNTITETKHFVVGVEGEIGSWNVDAGLTWSQNAINERYIDGYVKTANFNDLLKNPLFNPFTPAGSASPAL